MEPLKYMFPVEFKIETPFKYGLSKLTPWPKEEIQLFAIVDDL